METTISKLKKGQYFKKPGGRKVFKYDGKLMKGWFYFTNDEDINDTYRVKKDIKVVIGFTY